MILNDIAIHNINMKYSSKCESDIDNLKIILFKNYPKYIALQIFIEISTFSPHKIQWTQ